ncbi:MAG: diphosphomevalonate decarboxylase [Pseudomonadota bacterium]
MKANDIIQHLLSGKNTSPLYELATCFAPVNIALIKYWGKRNTELNLPVTNSLSIALPSKGTTTTIQVNSLQHDRYYLSGVLLDSESEFSKRLNKFCNYFRFSENYHYDIKTENNIPTAAGLASSASGFAALVLAFDQLFGWKLDQSSLSILARMGSGSACRSLWTGFVEWQKGEREDGCDSFASPLKIRSSQFLSNIGIGLLIFEKDKKIISSRQAMLNTVNTSPTYKNWPIQVEQDLHQIKEAITQHDFISLGEISERNALAMHATMLDSQPKTDFCTHKTREYREKIWALRKAGIPVYFTQDAGPNLKLLFQETVITTIVEHFPELEIIKL